MAQRAMPEPASSGGPEQIATLMLPPISDAGAAPALKESLSPLVLKGAPIRLLAGEVERITTACMQVLIAADRALAPLHAGLIVGDVSEPMRRAFGEMGLSAELDRWMAGHG
jgi:anti-anti-sigma regulatory factor